MVDWISSKFLELKGPRGRINFYLISIILGLTLLTVHLDMANQVWGFGTIIGYIFLLVGILGTLVVRRRDISLGRYWISVPILVIFLSSVMVIFGDIGEVQEVLAYASYILLMVGLYLVSRILGRVVFFLLIPLSLQLTIAGGLDIFHQASGYFGGMGLTGNPNLAGSILALSVLFLDGKWKWLVTPLLVGLFLTGFPWGVLGLAVVALVMLFKREGYFGIDWRIPATAGLVLVIFVVGFWTLGVTQELYSVDLVNGEFRVNTEVVDISLGDRVRIYQEVLETSSFVGKGAQMDTTSLELNRYSGIVHNVPLMIWDDLGIPASLAWLVLVGYLIIKSARYRYQFILILIASLVVYWYWIPTGLGPWFYALVGVASGDLDIRRNGHA